MITSYPASTFGNIYRQALQVQLKRMGTKFSLLREARKESINSVAAAVGLRPEILDQIENGKHDLRFKTFFALCDYYKIEIDSLIGKGELLHFTLE
jgi:transcriptional regulator with XRE-family HTH domain